MNGAPMPDPVRDAVYLALASYTGVAGLVVLLVAGIKRMFKAWIDGKEPLVGFGLTYALGSAAKVAMPGVYGGNDAKSWTLHLVILLVVAVGAKGIHDGVWNAFAKREKKEEKPQ